MKTIGFFANLLLTFALAFLLASPFVLSFRLLKSPPVLGGEDSGTVLSAAAASNRYLTLKTALIVNRELKLIAYAFPGQPTFYHQLFALKNESQKKITYQVRLLGVEGEEREKVAAHLYFNSRQEADVVTLSPGEEAYLNLKIETSIADGPPFPLQLRLIVEAL